MERKGFLTKPMLERVPEYLEYLNEAVKHGIQNVSATNISLALGYGEVLVRKDLAGISGAGKPKTGYEIKPLIARLESILSPDGGVTAVVIGAGKLGKAIFDYNGFGKYGIKITAAFDVDLEILSLSSTSKPIYPLSELNSYCLYHSVNIAIITVPSSAAQEVCDIAVSSGVCAIWNFAPIKLKVPKSIQLRNENLASSLALLAAQSTKKIV